MNRLDSYTDYSSNGVFSQIGITENKTKTKGLITLGIVLFAITTIVGGYMISGPDPFSISYMMVNLFLWGTGLVIILFGYNNRNIWLYTIWQMIFLDFMCKMAIFPSFPKNNSNCCILDGVSKNPQQVIVVKSSSSSIGFFK